MIIWSIGKCEDVKQLYMELFYSYVNNLVYTRITVMAFGNNETKDFLRFCIVSYELFPYVRVDAFMSTLSIQFYTGTNER